MMEVDEQAEQDPEGSAAYSKYSSGQKALSDDADLNSGGRLAEVQYGNYLEPNPVRTPRGSKVYPGTNAAKILILMLRNGPQTEADININLGIDSYALKRAVAALDSEGLIQGIKWRVPTRSRVQLLGLTQSGELTAQSLAGTADRIDSVSTE
jgi:hypothetical protein